MPNCTRGRGRSNPPGAAQPNPIRAAAADREPDMRRWPHPIPGTPPVPPAEGTAYYIRCALSYQNQLLSEIKTLLEQLAAARETTGTGAEKDAGKPV